MNPVSQSPSENESSSTVSSWSEDETPTISDDEFIVSDSEIAEAEAEESEEDDIELLYESFVNLREENKLFKQELAKQNNLLWEIYDELKENQRSEAKRCFEIMNMNDKYSYSLMRPADRLTYGEQSKSALWLTRGKMFIIRQTGYDASKQFGQFFGEKYVRISKYKRKIFEGFHSFGRKKFLFDEILNRNFFS